jgi:hypothetical protein
MNSKFAVSISWIAIIFCGRPSGVEQEQEQQSHDGNFHGFLHAIESAL